MAVTNNTIFVQTLPTTVTIFNYIGVKHVIFVIKDGLFGVLLSSLRKYLILHLFGSTFWLLPALWRMACCSDLVIIFFGFCLLKNHSGDLRVSRCLTWRAQHIKPTARVLIKVLKCLLNSWVFYNLQATILIIIKIPNSFILYRMIWCNVDGHFLISIVRLF